MDPSSEPPLAFPVPDWLAAHTEPTIEAMLSMLSAETQQLYRQYLADEVRSPRPDALLPASLRAFDRANCEVQRRNKQRHPERWPR
jgi:hypothetical protein